MAKAEVSDVAFIKTKAGGIYRATPLLLKRRDITLLTEEQGMAELAKQSGKAAPPKAAKATKAAKPKAEEQKVEEAPAEQPKVDIDFEIPDEIKDVMNG